MPQALLTFTALKLWIRQQERHTDCKYLLCLSSKVLLGGMDQAKSEVTSEDKLYMLSTGSQYIKCAR